jgi:hypothetical protein
MTVLEIVGGIVLYALGCAYVVWVFTYFGKK